MARSALAAGTDVVLSILISTGAFRLAESAASCRDLGNCTILTPLSILFVATGLIAYLGIPMVIWHQSLGQLLFLKAKAHT
ncbi:MAG: hypothetical protein ACR2JC_02540 [Chloroflexota bacterium]|nr:MAG: hypothetical protein DLM70_04765 [Chloroflexota bacterium]